MWDWPVARLAEGITLFDSTTTSGWIKIIDNQTVTWTLINNSQ